MIKRVIIRNFQSHKNTVIDFESGVNTFVGLSDSGKSSIFRAIRWVTDGKPLGDSFRSWWGGDTVVIIITEKHQIKRTKTSKTNEYQIDDGEPLKAFKHEVPEEVLKALGGFSSINLQTQIDLPYLISSTPGQVAAHFNKVADLESIDKSVKHIKSRISENNTQQKTNKINIQSYKQKYKELSWVTKAEEGCSTILEGIKKKEETEKIYSKLTTEIEKYVKNEENHEAHSFVLRAEQRLSGITLQLDGKKAVVLEKTNIEANLESIMRVNSGIEEYKSFEGSETYLETMEALWIKREKLKDRMNALDSHKDQVEDLMGRIKKGEVFLLPLEKDYKKEIKGNCPLCGSKTN